MPRPPRLTGEQIQLQIRDAEGWELVNEKLHKTFRFADFIEAWGFMAKSALVAQAMDHHPDWSNVYNTVSVHLSTHDAGGVTELDFQLARKMNLLI